jgi:hypothetical protein
MSKVRTDKKTGSFIKPDGNQDKKDGLENFDETSAGPFFKLSSETIIKSCNVK